MTLNCRLSKVAILVNWKPYNNGATIEEKGSESGEIVADEELDDQVRLTLEWNAKACSLRNHLWNLWLDGSHAFLQVAIRCRTSN